jgi:hypothetical protein
VTRLKTALPANCLLLAVSIVAVSPCQGTEFRPVCGEDPTVVFPSHLHNCIFGDEIEASFAVLNATEIQTISFTTTHDEEIDLYFQHFETDEFVYSVTYESTSQHHTIQPKEDRLSGGRIEIPFGADPNRGCGIAGAISIVSAQYQFHDGEIRDLNSIEGGIFISSIDSVIIFAEGDVFYSDGVSKVDDAVIEILAVNDVPFVKIIPYRGESHGHYSLGVPDDILGASANIMIRACVPNTCGQCSEPFQVHYEGAILPLEHDFILPIPAPISNLRSDIDGNGIIDAEDLLLLLKDWEEATGP